MKRLFMFMTVLLIICMTTNVSYSADEWGKTYGGDDHDEVYSIQQTTDGGYIVAGETESFGARSADMWILKLDQDGNVSWQKTYGGYSHDPHKATA